MAGPLKPLGCNALEEKGEIPFLTPGILSFSLNPTVENLLLECPSDDLSARPPAPAGSATT